MNVCACGKPLKVFASSGRVAKACSPAHYPEKLAAKARQAEIERARRENGCAYCGAKFNPSALHQKFCSVKCHDAAETARRVAENQARLSVVKCARCGAEFKQKTVGSRFCSRDCAEIGRSSWRRAKTKGAEVEQIDPLAVFMRDGLRCQICGKKTPMHLRGTTRHNAPELDHRVPLSKGGSHTYSNLQCACRACNLVKGNRTSAGQLPMFNEYQHGAVNFFGRPSGGNLAQTHLDNKSPLGAFQQIAGGFSKWQA